LEECSAEFIPRLSDRVEIKAYAMKIATNAARFEAWSDGRLVGLVAAYCNDYKRNSAFVTSVSLLRPWMGKGIAADLLSQCIEYVKVSGIGQIRLDVAQANSPAIKLYVKNGFAVSKTTGETVEMNLYLN
jgi:ribosomal protein S18 acetylase RimI-like enzyme